MLNTIPCANTQYLHAHLRNEERDERRESLIENRAAEMLKDLMPLNPGAIDEALAEVMNDPQSKDRTAILAAFAGTDDAALGTAVRAAAANYWLAYCRRRAEDAVDASPDADYDRDARADARLMALEG